MSYKTILLLSFMWKNQALILSKTKQKNQNNKININQHKYSHWQNFRFEHRIHKIFCLLFALLPLAASSIELFSRKQNKNHLSLFVFFASIRRWKSGAHRSITFICVLVKKLKKFSNTMWDISICLTHKKIINCDKIRWFHFCS